LRRSSSRAARAAVLALVAGATCALPAQRAFADEPPAAPRPRLTKPPKLVKFVEATYPKEEEAAGKAASVTLEIALSEAGAVTEARVVTSAGPAFDAAALAAVKQFTFTPAEIDDKPAPVKLTYRYDFVLKQAPKGPVVNLEGVVRDRFTKKPTPGVTVTVDGKQQATADENGHFSFEDVTPGKHTITIAGPRLTPISTEETIEPEKRLTVNYGVEPKEEAKPGEAAEEEADLEIVVVASKIKKEVVSTEIQAEEGRRVPGTQGDTLKVVQNLPGVARAAFGSGQLVVWGAAPKDTRVYVDGVRIPLLYHGGGLRATVNSELVRAINLAPGGYGPEYGRGLGGLVTVDTRALRSDGVHGYVAADVVDASAMVEAPLGAKTRVAVAGRKSYLDRSLKLVTSKDVGEFIPIPDYFDVQARLIRDLRENESLELFGLLSRDVLTRSVADADPAAVKSEQTNFTFGRVIVKYQRQLSDGSSVFVTPSFGRDFDSTVTRFGGAPSELSKASDVFGLRAGFRGKLAPQVLISAGLDVEASRSDLSRRGAVTSPPREGDIYVFGQQPPDRINADTWQATLVNVGPYGQLDWSLFGDKLHVVPGLRVEPHLIGGSRLTPVQGDTPSIGFTRAETALEPRLSAHWEPVRALSLKAAWGIYHQSPEPEDLSAVFGNPTLSVASANHVLGGVTYAITDTISVEAVGFYSKSQGLVARSQSATPLLARALVDEGEGRAYGGQILVRRALANGFFGWASYSLIRSERKDHPGVDYRLFDSDQTHVLTVVASYEPGLGFEIGARVRYASGYPRTPVKGAFFETRRDLYEPYFGPQNSIRIPAFFQADLRASKRFTFGRYKAEVYLDVQNVTNTKNAEDLVYSYDYKKKSYITGLPLLPVFGARADF
jgi:TonB family protein